MVYPGHTLIAGRCILIEQSCVCLAPYFVKGGWSSLFSSVVNQRVNDKNNAARVLGREINELDKKY